MPRAVTTLLPEELTTDVIDTLAGAESVLTEWRELAEACAAGPFARPLFALTWWRELGQGTLRIVTVRERGRLVALAPLHRRRVAHVHAVRWLGHGLGTVAQALVRPGHEAARHALWGAARHRGYVLDLLECREGSPLPEDDDLPNGHAVVVAERDACPVIDVRGDAQAHLEDRARRRVRRTVRTSRRRLDTAGIELTVRAADDLASLERLLPDVRRVFDVSEAHRPRQHLLAGEWESFTTSILREGVSSGEVLVLVAYLDEAPVVFDVILLSATTMSSWIGRFDPAAASYSPGHLLQCAGIDWADEHGYTTIDLLLGDSYYKQLWADRSYRTLELAAGSSGARATLGTVSRLRSRLRGRRPPPDDDVTAPS